MSNTSTGNGRIIVGIDGSEDSKNALRWAMTFGPGLGGTIEAVSAWQLPGAYGFSHEWAPDAFQGDSFATITEKVLHEAVAEVTDALVSTVTVAPEWSRVIPRTCCSTRPVGPRCLSWAAAGVEPSPGSSSARSASAARSTPRARSSWCRGDPAPPG